MSISILQQTAVREAGRFLAVILFMAWQATAGTWGAQQTIGDNGYSGSIAIDNVGNLTSVWAQSPVVAGTPTTQILASSTGFGLPWSTPPVNLSGVETAGCCLYPGYDLYPVVSVNSAGTVTAVYPNQKYTGSYADRPAGGNWGPQGNINGYDQFFVTNAKGDQAIVWSVGYVRVDYGFSSIMAVVRRGGSTTWSAPAVVVSGSHLVLQNAVVSPSGTVAFSWESFNAVCNRRLCQDSNFVLHVSTLAPGATTWADSGPLLGPDASHHMGQLAADGVGDMGLLSLSGGNVVSLVNHGGSSWGSPVIVASNSVIGFYPGAGYDNRSYKADLAGHAIFVGFGSSNLLAIDGNLTNNTWGKPSNISGSDQSPGYFDLAMSSLGSAIVVWEITAPGNGGTYLWRAATRNGPTVAWDAPRTAGQGFAFVGPPDGVAINDAGQAVVTFGGYTSDYLTRILYSNVYQP